MRQILPTGTVTFLFTDIEGSTRLWERYADAMRLALARHDEIVRDAFEASGGTIFKTIGDAFCAVFNTAPEAAAAAVNAQRALFAEAWQVDPPVRARMALHTGAADEREGDYYGQPVNRVARLLAAGHGGQILVSAVAQELIRDALPSGCSLRDLGDASLKDLSRPERVYQLQHPSLSSAFPPLRVLNNPELPNNLPQQPTSFVGREKEIAQVKELLLKSRLMTLVGAGGAGKSRLALQAAADLLDGSGDGVWFVELAALADPNLVATAVSQALGVKEAAGQSVHKTLLDALRDKSLLIVLDNCEHLLDACCSLATELLKSCPRVHILATSREPLGASGEQVYRVPSLSVPKHTGGKGNDKPHTVESLSQYESVRLFIERAKAVQPSFVITARNAPAVAQLCCNLDGIPLALELAAARVRSLSVEDVNARLDHRFQLLTGGARNILPRQQTLKATIDWSYDLLSEQDKTLLARLSVFVGGWALSAAEVVCAGGGTQSGRSLETWEILDLLTSLTDKSLVVYEPAADEGEPCASRYRMLESLHRYGQDRLDESKGTEAQDVRRRHRDWCVALAEEAEPMLTGAEAPAWLSLLETEHDNLRAALAWCDHSLETDDKAAALQLSGALWRFWEVRGHFSEGRQWLIGALHPLTATAQKAEALGESDLQALRAKALNGAGNLAWRQGDYDAAHALHQESLAIRRELGDQPGIANSLNNLGNVAYALGDYSGARSLHEDSLEIMRRIGNQRGIANSLNNLGNDVYEQSDYVGASALYREGLEIGRKAQDQQGIAYSLSGLGSVACKQGEYPAALTLHEESLAIRRRIGDQRGIAVSLNNLGIVAQGQGSSATASSLHQQALTIMRQIGDQRGIAYSLEYLADAGCQGSPERSVKLWNAASLLREQLRSPLASNEQRQQNDRMVSARAALDGSAYDAAGAAGRAMTSEQAVEYALSGFE